MRLKPTVKKGHDFSDNLIVFGEKPELPTSILKEPEFKYTYDNYIDDLSFKLSKSREIARKYIMDSKEKNKAYYDRKTNNIEFKVGDKIYLQTEQFSKSRKLSPNYTGSYEVIKKNSEVNVTIRFKGRNLVVHTNRLKHANLIIS